MEHVWNPLTELDIPPHVEDKTLYTGYLRRSLPQQLKRPPNVEIDDPYLLVTGGGGGDGYELFDWVLSAYERDPTLPYAPLFVLGPFMNAEQQDSLNERIEKLPRAQSITFDSHVEFLMAEAAGVIAMGGYNTFCEILSFDKPAIIVPRCHPRQEQLVRAQQAERLGIARMLRPDDGRDPAIMASAIRELPDQRPPSGLLLPGMLEGLEQVADLARPHLMGVEEPQAAVEAI
jgi:predicted glycosyltransferase